MIHFVVVSSDVFPQIIAFANYFTASGLMGDPGHRLVCNKSQQTTSSLCVPHTGPRSRSKGRLRDPVDGPEHLRVFAHKPHTTSHRGGDSREATDSHRPMVGSSILVSSVDGSSRRSHASRYHSARHHSTRVRSRASRPVKTSTDRLEVIRRGLESLGLDKPVIDSILKSRRDSTAKLYGVRWRAWAQFCAERKWDPLRPKDTQFVRFLHHLHVAKQLSGQCLAGYRAAIVSTIELSRGITNPSFASSVIVKHYIDGVKNVRSALS